MGSLSKNTARHDFTCKHADDAVQGYIPSMIGYRNFISSSVEIILISYNFL